MSLAAEIDPNAGDRRRGRRFSLRQKINAAIFFTFVLIVLAFSLVQLPLQQQRVASTIDKVQVLLQTLVERDQEPLANEIFEQQRRAIELRLRQMLGVKGILAIALFDVNRKLILFDSLNKVSNRWPELQLDPADPTQESQMRTVDFNSHQALLYVQQLRLIGDPIGYIQIWYSLDDIQAEQQTSLIMFLALLSLVLVLMLGLLNLLLSRTIVQPIQQLGLAMEKVQSGALGSQVDVRGADEISHLGRAFNRMSLELKKNREGLHDWNLHLQSKVEERTADLTRLNQELLNAKQAAEQATAEAHAASQAKSQFLANMSHEIRTPMNAIIGFSHLAIQADPPPQQRDYLQKISAASKGLLGIINDILDFSRIEADKMTLECVPFSLTDMLANLRNLFSHLVAEKKISFSIQVRGDIPPALSGDPLRLQQVLTNLIGNAIKFTDNGAVAVQVTVLPDDVFQFSVRDTGIGMSELTVRHLFNAFTQADSSTSRRFGGTGLGLAISQRLIRLMQGEIHVKSQPGCGSEFSFLVILPSVNVKPAPAPAAPLSSTIIQQQLRDRRVLVVDDSRLNQQVAREILQNAGLQVQLAGSGRDALQLLATEPVDVVLLDIQMPDMDGFELSAALRAKPQFAQLPLVAMTAHNGREFQDKFKSAGINDQISKPVDPEQMLQVLHRVLIGANTGQAGT